MSFDFNNSINNNLSNVQASAKSCPGGGGNTGYFKRGQGDEDDKMLEFAKDYPSDSFEKVELSDLQDEDEDAGFFDELKKFIVKLVKKIKSFFRKS